MGSELLINAMFGAFVEQVEVLIAQRRKETVRIVELPDFTVGLLDSQPVTKHLRAVRNERLDEAQRIQLLHRLPPFGLVLVIHQFTSSSFLPHSPAPQTRPPSV